MAKPGPQTTCRYSPEFKATAVRLSQLPGVAVQDVAQSLYIHPFMLSRWRKQAREGRIMTKGVAIDKDIAAELKELRRVKKAYEQLKIEHDLLKKAIAFTSALRQTSSPSSTTTKKPSR
jgi:transposase